MIKLTRLDGSEIFLNNCNIQWIETLPDTTITILSGVRIIVRERIDEVLKKIDNRIRHENKICVEENSEDFYEKGENFPRVSDNI